LRRDDSLEITAHVKATWAESGSGFLNAEGAEDTEKRYGAEPEDPA
jgi:hypothetical protein